MGKAKDLASYILEKQGHAAGYQLQALLYYCQAWSLVIQGRPLFDEQVRAWERGPVVPEVYREYAGRGDVPTAVVDGDPRVISAEDSLLVEEVLQAYGSMTGDELEALSHSEDPWRNAYNGSDGESAACITCQSMLDFCSSLMASDRDTRNKHHVPLFSAPQRMFIGADEYDWLVANAL